MWYILNYIPPRGKSRSGLQSIIDAFNSSSPTDSVELFAPSFVSLVSEGENVKKTEKPLLYHYIFVRGSAEAVKQLCLTFDGFSFVIDRTGTRRHLSVSDEALEQFRIIAHYYSGKLPCYPLEGITLEEGDRVQIVSGPCTGLTGTYISRKGGKSGNILVAIDGSMAAIVYDVKAEYVRVLEFSRDSRRVYDQLDAYAERLLKSDFGNDLSDIAAASVFTTRLGIVNISNPKLAAKLAIMLFAAYSILGDAENARQARESFEKLSHNITNPKTLSLVSAILTRFEK